MALGLGSTSYLLLAYQSAQEKASSWADYKDTIYQFNSGGIGLDATFGTTPANKGNLGPTVTTPGIIGSAGSIRIAHDQDKMGFWLQQMMLDSSIDSTQIASATYSFLSAAAMTNDTAIAGPVETSPAASTKKQPRYKLPTYANGNTGLNCAQATFTFTAAADVPADGATIKVKGLDQGLVYLEETLELNRGDDGVGADGTIAINTEFKTTKRFAQIDNFTPSGFTTPGSVKVDIDPTEYYRHVIEIGNSLLNGLSIEMVKGDTPSLYQDVHIGEATYTIGAQNEISMTLSGGKGQVGVNAEDGGSSPSSLSGKSRPQGLSAVGLGTIFRLNDMEIKVGEGSVSLNHQLGEDENPFSRNRFRTPPIQTANRALSLSARVSYPAQLIDGTELSPQDLNALAYGTDVNAQFDVALMDHGEGHNTALLEIAYGRLAAFPDPRDVSQGQISNRIEVNAYAKGSTPDLRITVFNNQDGTAFIS